MSSVSHFLINKIKDPFPYLKEGYRHIKKDQSQKSSDRVYALTSLGEHSCLISGIYAASKYAAVASPLLLGVPFGLCAAFTALSYEVYTIRNLEKTLQELNNIRNNLQETAEKMDNDHKVALENLEHQIQALSNESDGFRKENRDLAEQIAHLKETINIAKITANHIQELQLQEKKSLTDLEETTKKLEIVKELFKEEREKLSTEIHKLQHEVTRLQTVPS